MRHFLKLVLAAVFACLLGAALAWAGITGSISGVVTDQNGGVIVGAKVTAIETQTGVRREITTDSQGFYNFPALPVGKYDIEVRSSGFKLYQQSGLVIDVNSALRVDVSLQIGEASEKVTVLSEAVHVETQSTQNGQVIDGKKILAIPLNGRSYTDLLSSQPGVVPSAYTNQAPDTNDRAPSGDLHQGNVSVNGQRESSNGFMVNGANVEEGKNNGTTVVPNLDSIEEFRIITNNFDAEYGNYSGGQINVATKSGTNAFHGSAFEFLRNTDLDARNFFNPAPGAKGDFKQNQFGGTGGGPIKRDKLFFFGDYQGTRQIKGNTVTTNVPLTTDLPDASGNANVLDLFQSQGSNLVRGQFWADALTSRLGPGQTVQVGEPYWTPGCNSTNPATGCVFPGGIIPKAAISPIASKLLGFIPAPNATNPSFNFSSSLAQRLTDNKGAIRIDDNTRFGVVSGYYFLDDYTLNNPIPSNIGANVPGFGAATSGRAQLGTLGDTKTFGSTAVNEFRISYTRSAAHIGKPSQGVAPGTMSKLGFTVPATAGGVFNGGIAPIDPALDGVPTITFNTIGTILGVPSTTTAQFNNTYQVQDNFTKVLGTHTWKFGGQFHYDQINERNLFGEDGTFLFDGTETGVDLADFLLGAVGNGSSGAFTQASKQLLDSRSKYFGVFVQDSWRVKSSLTFNYGLRWEFGQPWYDTQNKISTVVPGEQSVVFKNAPKGLLFPGDPGIPKTLALTQHNAFSPRVGLAYSPGMSQGLLSKLTGGPGKTSIRGGFGIFYTAFEDLSQFQEVGDIPFGLFWAPPGQKFFEAPFFDRITGPDGQKFPFVLPSNATPQHPNTTFDFTPFEPLSGNAEVAFWHTNRLPYAEHFDLSVQRQLGANTLLSAGYVGTLGHKLIAFVNYNPSDHNLCSFLIDPAVSGRPNPNLAPGSPGCSSGNEDAGPFLLAPGVTAPGYPGITSFATTRLLAGLNSASDAVVPFGNNAAEKTIANSAYHSFQATIRHTSTRGEFLFGYTYGKCLDNSSGLEDPMNPFNPKVSRGLCLFDVRHNFVTSFSVPLPFEKLFHANSGWTKRVAGGWQVSGATTFATGLPIRISEGNDVSLAGSIGTDVPQLTGTGKLFAGGSFSSTNPRAGLPYFNNCILSQITNCAPGAVPYFDLEQVGQIGNANRRSFHGPGLNDWVMALFKDTKITETKVLELRFEAFNVFNHAQFQNPTGNIDSSTFGRVTGANDARILQIAAKFRF